jgi:hypothetical protein
MQIDNAGPLGTLVLSNVIDGADLMGDPVPPFCTITSSDVLSTP